VEAKINSDIKPKQHRPVQSMKQNMLTI